MEICCVECFTMIDAYAQYAGEFKQVARHPRKFITSVLNLGCVVFSALMLWKGLMVLSGSESPVVAVMSGSMEPGFHRGDILFLELTSIPFTSGDVTVFTIEGREVPIVHRSLNIHAGKTDNSLAILTKGDNNNLDDRQLYNRGQDFITKKNLMGRARAFVPYLGMVTIWMNDYPWLKIVAIGLMSFFVMIGRE